MTMREKIAEIFKRHHRDSCYPDAMDFEALAAADAVLDALREPTEEMCDAGWIDKEDVDPEDIWRAMIDAAKGETE